MTVMPNVGPQINQGRDRPRGVLRTILAGEHDGIEVGGRMAVAAFIAISTATAFRFGWTLGADECDRWLYASAGAFADALKAFLPLLIVTAWLAGQYVRSVAGAALFAAVTAYSITSSFGLAAIQRADKLGEHVAAITTYRDRRADLDRLIAHRIKIDPQPVAGSAEALAQAAVNRAEASAASECVKRGPECRKQESIARDKRDELAALVTARAVNQRLVGPIPARSANEFNELDQDPMVDLGSRHDPGPIRDANPQPRRAANPVHTEVIAASRKAEACRPRSTESRPRKPD
jgi:hypothetical protein